MFISEDQPNQVRLVVEVEVWNFRREADIKINYENVLEGLQPHPSLKMLQIFGFRGASFPSWILKMSVQDEVKGLCVGLTNLTEIKLSCCSGCEEIPMTGHLPHLKALFLNGMWNMKSIGASFYGIDNLCSSSNGGGGETINVFPSLKRIELSDMPKLIEWVKLEIPNAVEPRKVKVFPLLEYLKIKKCPELVSAPSHEFSCLKRLDIDECNNLVCLPNMSFHNNHNLSKLYIKKCPKLRELPDGLHALASLRKLKIHDCPNLEELDTVLVFEDTCGIKLTLLTEIWIWNLEGLVCLPKWLFSNSPNLTQLWIWDCLKLRELPDDLHALSSLKELSIQGCPNLEKLDTGLPSAETFGIKLLSLTKLEIKYLGGLAYLPNWLFRNNSNLKAVLLRDCSKLRELPDGLHTLTSLKELTIEGCPNLKSIAYDSSSGRGGLTSLRNLSIGDCKGLMSLPCEMVESCAQSLQKMRLQNLESLTNLPMIIGCLHKMPHLWELKIVGVPKLIMTSSCTLSNLRHLGIGPAASDSWDSFNSAVDEILQAASQSSLRELSLTGMEDWDNLPDQIQQLTTLATLRLTNYGIQEIPEWFGHLINLTELDIKDCPVLKERCGIEQRTSSFSDHHSQWPKICHIPDIYIDGNTFQGGGWTFESFRYLDDALLRWKQLRRLETTSN